MSQYKTHAEWKGNAVARFFLWCSGARIYLLKKCPTEINMFLGIGIVVFLTGMVASISGGYAFYMVFQSITLAVIFGIFWGILIFFLDWYLVASLKKERKWWKEFTMALPRITLAVFIAIVVARPIEMKLFEKEIDLQVHQTHLAKREQQQKQIAGQFNEIRQLKAENDSLQHYLREKAERRNHLYDLMIAEAEGRSAVGIVGKGPVYREKQQEYKHADRELKNEKQRILPVIKQNRDRIERLNEKKDNLTAGHEIVITRANGFLSRLKALNQLQESEKTVKWASLFILLLFIAIEISPVFVKLISSRGPYDELLLAEQAAVSHKASGQIDHFRQKQRLSKMERNQKQTLLENQNEEVLTDAYKKLTDAKQTINSDRINRWKELQLKKNGTTVNKNLPDLIDIDHQKDMDLNKNADQNPPTPSS